MLSSFVLPAVLLLEAVKGHGRLTEPMARIGSATDYENDPIGFEGRSWTHFACRHANNPAVTPEEVQAGGTVTLSWDLTANHVGDAAVYISYDVDKPMEEIDGMEFFKIANLPKAKLYENTDHVIELPDWLPAGRAVLRWEWYALHVNPTIEFYVQCADINIAATADAKAKSEIPMYRVYQGTGIDGLKTLPSSNKDDNAGMYRNAFNQATDQFMTGPECALGFNKNECAETAVDTVGWIDVCETHNQAMSWCTGVPHSTTTAAPVQTTTDNGGGSGGGQSTTTEAVATEEPANVDGSYFFLDSSTDMNTRRTLANIGGLLAQCAWESGGDAPFSACDENNYMDWEDAACSQREDGTQYNDLVGPGACAVDPNMVMTAETYASWTPGPMKCAPGTVTEGCCWWGRGAIQTTGPLNYGLLQSDVVDHMPGMEDVNLCTNPEALCQKDELKFAGAMYYWASKVQTQQCFSTALDAFAANFDNSVAPSGNCAKFSAGIGGAINNGIWNDEAHREEARQSQFVHMMTYLEEGYDLYDDAPPSFECTGDEKIDRILELGDMREESAIEDKGVYTWHGFCSTLRTFIGGEPLPTHEPVPSQEPTSPPPTPGCVDETQVAGDDCRTNTCCATGHYCKYYSEWWSSCTVNDGNEPVQQPTSTVAPPASTTTEAAPPASTTTKAAEATTTKADEATTTTAAEATTTKVDEATTSSAPAPVTSTSTAPVSGCESQQDGATCGGEGWTGTTCCAAGLECYAETQWWSGCKPACQAGWLCNQDMTDPNNTNDQCPTRTSGGKCGGNGFTDQPGCCAFGYICYKYDNYWSGCFATCPQGQGYTCPPP